MLQLLHKKTIPPYAQLAAMILIQTNNFKTPLNTFETLLKHFWNTFETLLKHFWNTFETFSKHFWNTFETLLKHF